MYQLFPIYTFMVSHYIYGRHSCVPVGGGRVTRFPFGPPNVFEYISHWAARANYQNRPHFDYCALAELTVNARTSWCDSPGCKSKKHDKILMQNWNVILPNLIYFSDLVAPAERFFVQLLLGPNTSVGFSGAMAHVDFILWVPTFKRIAVAGAKLRGTRIVLSPLVVTMVTCAISFTCILSINPSPSGHTTQK